MLDGCLGRILQLAQRARYRLRRALRGYLSSLAQLLDRANNGFARLLAGGDEAALQVQEGLIDSTGRGVACFIDETRDVLAVVHHRLGEIEALGFYSLHRVIGDPA